MTVKSALWKSIVDDVGYTEECLKKACSALSSCGVLQYLVELAKPVGIDTASSNYAEAHIAEMNRCAGVNAVLDILLNFKALKAATGNDVALEAPMFGATEYLSSVLTDSEIKELNKHA